MNKLLKMVALAATVTGAADAQVTRKLPTTLAQSYSWDEPNAARIGVYLGENGVRDTLGVLVNSVAANGPAAKAGLKEGDRIQAINGINLRISRDDAEDSMLSGMMNRRLIRELDKLKAGDEVDLRVWSGGAAKSVRIKTVAARELDVATRPEPWTFLNRNDERVSLGISLGGSVSTRDTLGVFVVGVSAGGPAEKAGIVEGDRIARINGMDLRVPAEEAGDGNLTRARIRRFTAEVNKLKAGDDATLSVVSGGRTREVRVTSVKTSELPHDNTSTFFFGDGSFQFPSGFPMPKFQVFPKGSIRGEPEFREFRFDGDQLNDEIREKIERAMEGARKSMENIRIPSGTIYYRGADNDVIRDRIRHEIRSSVDDATRERIRESVERALEQSRDAIERARRDGEVSRIRNVKRT